MKRTIHIVSLLIAIMLVATPAYARKPRAFLIGGKHTNMSGNQWHIDHNGLRSGTFGYVHYLFGGYIDGGYSCLFSDVPNTHYQPGGYNVGGGVCLENQRGIWKFQVGAGLRYQNVSNRIDNVSLYDYTVSDARGYKYTLRYDFNNRKDSLWALHAQVPILFGIGLNGFYCLTGVKVNCSIRGGSYVRCGEVSTSGTYDQFLGQFWEMDNHGFRKNVELLREGDEIEFNTDLLLSLETGYEWGDYQRRGVRYRRKVNLGECVEYRLRVAAFVDYGLLNICPNQNRNYLSVPSAYKWDFSQYEMNHVFGSSIAKSCDVHNFYVGIKFTAMIGFYTYKTCRLCTEFETEADINTRGNHGRRR